MWSEHVDVSAEELRLPVEGGSEIAAVRLLAIARPPTLTQRTSVGALSLSAMQFLACAKPLRASPNTCQLLPPKLPLKPPIITTISGAMTRT